ncbi:MAG: DMT family transporter [Anaerolineales bacterium]|nr:DMT family transporter [Anaerolineales bacterium]
MVQVAVRNTLSASPLQKITGFLLVITSAASFGTLAILGRAAYANGMDTYTLLFLRFSLAAIFMFGLLALRKERLPSGKTLLQLMGMGAIGYVGQSFCYLTAIKYASAGLVALLLYLYPSFVALLSVIFLKHRFNGVKLIALVLATLGAVLTADPQGGQPADPQGGQPVGILLAIGGAAIYSVYIVVGAGVMERVSAVQSSSVIFASAGAVFGVLTALNGPHLPVAAAGWWTMAGVVVVATIIPVSTFLGGLKLVGPTEASVVLAAWIYGEMLRPLSLLGGGLILAAVLLLTAHAVHNSHIT